MLKFIVFSLIGLSLFVVPIPTEDAPFNIPLGILADWLGDFLGGFAVYLVLTFITVSAVGSVVAYLTKPKFITRNHKLDSVFLSSPMYLISKVVGAVFGWMVYLQIGPEAITGPFTGGLMVNDLMTGLVSIFLVLAFAMPVLTEFGIMEFLGTLIRKVVRVLFKLPGRASIDLMASWFGSSTASVILTRNQHEKGFYTGREAATICVNFAFVSVPFSFVIAGFIGIEALFLPWYLVICATCVLLAIILPRIWPLKGLPDEYLPEVGKQIDEEVPSGQSTFKWAMTQGAERANQMKASDVMKSVGSTYMDIFLDLMPIVIAWGTIALVVFEETQIFHTLAMPFGLFLELLQVEGAQAYAPAVIVGFLDMFLPAVLLSGEYVPVETQFVLGALSIIQVIYMTETGLLIAKSKIPVNMWQLMVVFLLRTLIGLPIIVLLTRLFVGL